MTSTNYHACALEIAGTGLLVEGPSGSGKTSLTLGLLEKAAQLELSASLVADDQVFIELDNGNIFASVPESIAGKLELYGFGIVEHPYQPQTIVKLIVRLTEQTALERMPENKFFELIGVSIPVIEVPRQHEQLAVRCVYAWLKKNADLQLPANHSN